MDLQAKRESEISKSEKLFHTLKLQKGEEANKQFLGDGRLLFLWALNFMAYFQINIWKFSVEIYRCNATVLYLFMFLFNLKSLIKFFNYKKK